MARNHKATGLADFICFTIPARRRVQGLRIDGSSGTLQQRLKSAARGPDVPQQARSSNPTKGAVLVGGSIGLRAWHAVRVLSGPPRILPNREISRRLPRSPQLAGFCGCVLVSAETVSGLNAILGVLSLGRGISFPRCRSILDKTDP